MNHVRLFEAIVEANHRAISGDKTAGLRPAEYAESLPIIALTCIDPRLNRLLPEVLGVPEEQFIWLRNAGNIITSTTSSTMRSLALACVIKGGKEIVILGHTDCRVGKTSTMELTDKFKALGIERGRLPENLVEFFGMFASERQNVIRGVDFVRQSPLIGSKIPVHGVLVDIQTGKLEWVVNGYQTLATAVSGVAQGAKVPVEADRAATIPAFHIGEMKFPDTRIGEVAAKAPETVATPSQMKMAATPTQGTMSAQSTPKAQQAEVRAQKPAKLKVERAGMYKVLGDDRKVYGPVTAAEIERWIEEGRIDLKTLVQKLGYHEWKKLEQFVEQEVPPEIPLPPALNTALKVIKTIKDKTRPR